MKETLIEFLANEKFATFYTEEMKWVNRIRKLQEQYPESVRIRSISSDDEGVGLTAEIPISWVKIKPPIKRNYTEEQKDAFRERMKKSREVNE